MKTPRPCHSIHCRHYDLADGRKCEVQVARENAQLEVCLTCTRKIALPWFSPRVFLTARDASVHRGWGCDVIQEGTVTR